MLIPITIVIPIFNDVLILDKGENVINNSKHVLFHILKCSDKLCWYNSNIVDIIQIQNERFHSSSRFTGICHDIRILIFGIFWPHHRACIIYGENIQGVKNKLQQVCKIIYLTLSDINSHWLIFKISENKI